MRLSSTNMDASKMLFAAILSICALSSKKISIYNEEMIVAVLGRFLGSEGTASAALLSGVVVVVFSIFFYRLIAHRMRNRSVLALAVYFLLSLFIIVYVQFFFSVFIIKIGVAHSLILKTVIIYTMAMDAPIIQYSPGPGREVEIFEVPLTPPEAPQPQDHPAAGTASPSPEHGIRRNVSLEGSLQNRVNSLIKSSSIFLLGDGNAHWTSVKAALMEAPNQAEYNRVLDFESRDLRIRESKEACTALLTTRLSQHPDRSFLLSAETLVLFFDIERETLEVELEAKGTGTQKIKDLDLAEIEKLQLIERDLKNPRSFFAEKFLNTFDITK